MPAPHQRTTEYVTSSPNSIVYHSSPYLNTSIFISLYYIRTPPPLLTFDIVSLLLALVFLLSQSHKPSHEFDTTQSVQSRLYRHTRVWSLLADLQENYSSLDATCAVYDRAIQLRVITPQMLLNYAALLEEHKRFEEAFRVYEKGIAVFTYPHVAPIWLCYLRKFVSRNAGRKLERTRDLFEQACRTAPKEHSRKLYLLYAKFEETYGLGKSMTGTIHIRLALLLVLSRDGAPVCNFPRFLCLF